jgi:hypothetical protein
MIRLRRRSSTRRNHDSPIITNDFFNSIGHIRPCSQRGQYGWSAANSGHSDRHPRPTGLCSRCKTWLGRSFEFTTGKLPTGITFFRSTVLRTNLDKVGLWDEQATPHRRSPGITPPLPQIAIRGILSLGVFENQSRDQTGGQHEIIPAPRCN